MSKVMIQVIHNVSTSTTPPSSSHGPLPTTYSNHSTTYNTMASLTMLYMASYVILLFIASASIFIHSVGLLAIHLHKKESNSNLILASLSTAEILASIHRIIYEVTEEAYLRGTYHFQELKHGPIEGAIFYVSGYAMCLIMYVLTLDRMICAATPLKYRSRMTRKRTAILLIIAWLLGIALGCMTGLLEFRQRVWTNMIGIALGGIYIFFAIATYSLIVIRIRSAQKQFGLTKRATTAGLPAIGSKAQNFRKQRMSVSRRVSSRLALKSGKEFLVPTIIISSYILMYIAPIVVNNFSFVEIMGNSWRELGDSIAKERSVSIAYVVITVLPHMGVIVDGFTYIFLTKHYRRNVTSFIRRGRGAGRTLNSMSAGPTTNTSTAGVSTIRRSRATTYNEA